MTTQTKSIGLPHIQTEPLNQPVMSVTTPGQVSVVTIFLVRCGVLSSPLLFVTILCFQPFVSIVYAVQSLNLYV